MEAYKVEHKTGRRFGGSDAPETRIKVTGFIIMQDRRFDYIIVDKESDIGETLFQGQIGRVAFIGIREHGKEDTLQTWLSEELLIEYGLLPDYPRDKVENFIAEEVSGILADELHRRRVEGREG